MGLPARIDRTAVAKAVNEYAAAGRGGDAEFEAVIKLAIKRLQVFASAMSIPTSSWGEASFTYATALRDVPLDLIDLAVERTIKTWKWANRLPPPAEIAAQVSEERAARAGAQARLQMALTAIDRRHDDAIAKQRAQAAADIDAGFLKAHGITIAEAKKRFAEANSIPWPTDDHGETIRVVRGAMTIYAPGFGPAVNGSKSSKPILDQKTPFDAAVAASAGKAENRLETPNEGFRPSGAATTGPENHPINRAENGPDSHDSHNTEPSPEKEPEDAFAF